MEHLAELLTDPSHWAFEFITSIVQFLLLGILWAKVGKPLFKKYVQREHDKIDAEHGVQHKEIT